MPLSSGTGESGGAVCIRGSDGSAAGGVISLQAGSAPVGHGRSVEVAAGSSVDDEPLALHQLEAVFVG